MVAKGENAVVQLENVWKCKWNEESRIKFEIRSNVEKVVRGEIGNDLSWPGKKASFKTDQGGEEEKRRGGEAKKST